MSEAKGLLDFRERVFMVLDLDGKGEDGEDDVGDATGDSVKGPRFSDCLWLLFLNSSWMVDRVWRTES